MKKTLILAVLLGCSSAFGAVELTASGISALIDFGTVSTSGVLNISSDSLVGTADMFNTSVSYTLSSSGHAGRIEDTNTNKWCGHYTGTLPGSFAEVSDTLGDGVHVQRTGGRTPQLTLTLTGLAEGTYSFELLGTFTGEDTMSDITLDVTSAGVSNNGWTTQSLNAGGEWVSFGASAYQQHDAAIYHNEWGNGSSTTGSKGYYIATTPGAITVGEDGILTMTVSGLDINANTTSDAHNANYSRITLSALKLTQDMVATPEPATATLSLLALAGLCARRRRH